MLTVLQPLQRLLEGTMFALTTGKNSVLLQLSHLQKQLNLPWQVSVQKNIMDLCRALSMQVFAHLLLEQLSGKTLPLDLGQVTATFNCGSVKDTEL